MRKKILIAAMLATGLVAGLLVAQAPLPPAPEANSDTADIRENVVNVQVPVIVRDREGNFVNGLAATDFELIDEGIRQVVNLDVAIHPISVVIAVQSNAAAEKILPTVVKSASLFSPLIAGETGEVAVIGFDHRIQVHTGFTSDPDVVKAAFAKLKPGSTPSHLDDAAMEAVNMLRTRSKDRKRVLILVSETRDVQSSFSPRDVLTNAEFANVQIYAVEMNHLLNQLTAKALPNRPKAVPAENRPSLPMGVRQTGTTDAQTNMGNWTPIFKEVFDLVKGVIVPNSLEVYTKFTGGREQNFVSTGGLEEAILKISEELHSQYLLTFNPSSKTGGYHEIVVNVTKAANLDVNTRRGYWIAPRGVDEDVKGKKK